MRIIITLIRGFASASLAACSEKSQQLAPSREPGGETDRWKHQLRDRGQTQNESNRIYY